MFFALSQQFIESVKGAFMTEKWVGKSTFRKEGEGKLKGESQYIDDLHDEGILHAATIRSSVPRGILKNIRFEGNLPWDEFTIVTAKDITGNNYVALLENDQPYLVESKINHSQNFSIFINRCFMSSF